MTPAAQLPPRPTLTNLATRPTRPILPIAARSPERFDLRELGVLAELADADDVLGVLRRSARIAAAAERVREDTTARAVIAQLDRLLGHGGAAALAAVEILAAVPGPEADARTAGLLHHPDALVARHAGWRLGEREHRPAAVPALLRRLEAGGIDTMHAHRTLLRWAGAAPTSILRATTEALAAADAPAPRARLVDLVGAVPDRGTDALLVDLATDPDEVEAARIAAIGALAERDGGPVREALARLARTDDLIGAHAALALRAAPRSAGRRHGRNGLRIAQLVLAGDLDGQLSRGGRGETGGVASLLVSLGGALGRRDDVEHVLTIGRGAATDALTTPLVADDEPWSYGTIALGDPSRPVTSPGDGWEHLPGIARELRRVLALAGPIDVVHLRMADVGTLVGAEVAAAAGIPVCFSVAPDPHNVIQSLQSRGELGATEFARLEAEQHVWFRARLVERLTRDADRLALFPRARPWEFFDAPGATAGEAGRAATIAEGIDHAAIERAEIELASGRPPDVLDELASCLPEHRRDLPLLISVGRLNPVKGMERIAAAWSDDPGLRRTCNLVIVGGDLDEPSPSERGVLDAIDDAIGGRADGVVLLGGRPHADIARLLVAAARGHAGGWAAGGVYVDGALKEEFGLAVLEAMAAGLVVVAPSTGGPSTYVAPDDTGILVPPGADLAKAIRRGFGLVARPGRAHRARSLVRDRYSVEVMAEQLAELYRPAAA